MTFENTSTLRDLIPASAPAPVFKALAAAGMMAPFLSYGAIITVNTSAADGAAGFCSLRDAAAAITSPGSAVNGCAVADAAPLGNEIRFAANVVGTITYTNPDDLFNFSGVEFITRSNLTITGPGASTLGLSCASNSVSIGSMLIFANAASNIAISGLSFNNCLASGTIGVGGGGLTVIDVQSNAANQITLSDLIVSGNRGTVGGIGVSSTGLTTLRRLSITGNTGDEVGGIAVQGRTLTSDIDLQSSTIANNTTPGGPVSGGFFLVPGDISVNNTTVSGNTGGQTALGLLTDSAFGVRHSTIVRNTSSNVTNYAALLMLQGGFSGGTASAKSARVGAKALTVDAGLNNSIVCGNSNADFGIQGNVVANYNLLGTQSATTLGGVGGTGNVTGCTAAQLNNWLGPLANNGGPTQTHALLNVAGNPAINGGDPAYIGSPGDQTGINPRTSNGRTDMGAFELVAAAANGATAVPVNGLAGLGALSLALAALGARRRKKSLEQKD